MAPEPAPVEALLAPYRERSNQVLAELWREWLEDRGPSRYPSGKTMRRHARLLRAGKRYRYALALLGHEGMAGRPAEKGVEHAAAWLELYHLYTLFLDDIMDEDVRRRTLRSAWSANAELFPGRGQNRKARVFASQAVRYGVSQAILDALRLRSLAELAIEWSELDVAQREALLEELTATDLVLSDGQGLDLDFEWAKRIPEREYVGMSEKKTGRLFLAAAATAAITSGAGPDARRAYESFARHFSMAFQDRDDLLGSGVVESRIGGSAASDVAQGKRTRLYAIAVDRLPPKERAAFVRSYGRGARTTDRDLALVRRLLREHALPTMLARIEADVRAAMRALDEVPFRDPRPRAILVALAKDQLGRVR